MEKEETKGNPVSFVLLTVVISNRPLTRKLSRAVRISELLPTNHRLQLRYFYDFGDSREHVVNWSKILSTTLGTRYPLCMAGTRACPPEDCAGIYGYFDFVEAVSDPKHERHDELPDWHGPYNPEAFDPSTATKSMRRFGRG